VSHRAHKGRRDIILVANAPLKHGWCR
jgi:hypothetical protein